MLRMLACFEFPSICTSGSNMINMFHMTSMICNVNRFQHFTSWGSHISVSKLQPISIFQQFKHFTLFNFQLRGLSCLRFPHVETLFPEKWLVLSSLHPHAKCSDMLDMFEVLDCWPCLGGSVCLTLYTSGLNMFRVFHILNIFLNCGTF